jgi:general secretion pathway protein L
MNKKKITAYLLSLKSACLNFGAWWISELAACIPPAIKKVIHGLDPMPIIILANGSASIHYPNDLLPKTKLKESTTQKDASSAPVLVALDSCEVYQNRFRMPTVSKSKLRQAVLFEIERRSPMHRQNAAIDFSILHYDPGSSMMDIEWVLAPDSAIEHAKNTTRKLGFFPLAIGLAEDNREKLRYVFSRTKRPFCFQNDKSLLVCLGALGLFLGSISFVFFAVLLHPTISGDALAELKNQAAVVQSAKTDTQKMVAGLQQLDARSKEPRIAEILSQLTQVLPDDSWIFELDLTGNQLRIVGYSASATALVGRLATVASFDNPHFQAPITPQVNAPNNKPLERFDIVMAVRGRTAAKETE